MTADHESNPTTPPPVEDREELDLRAYLTAVWLRRYLVLGIAAASMILAALFSVQQTTIYASTASLKLAKPAPDPTQERVVWWDDSVSAEHVNTQIRILQSTSLAQTVLETNEDIADELEVEAGTSDKEVLAGYFQSGVSVTRVRDTHMVEVTYESEYQERCPRYANALAKAYTDQLDSMRGQKIRLAAEKIGQEMAALRLKLETSEDKLEEFLRQNDIAMFESYKRLLEERMRRVDVALGEVRFNVFRLEAEQEAIDRALQYHVPLENTEPIANNAEIQKLRSSLKALDRKLQVLKARRYGENWPEYVALTEERQLVKEALRSEVLFVRNRLKSNLHTQVAEQQGLLTEKAKLKEESTTLDKQIRMHAALEAEVEANRAFYREFANRLKDVTHKSGLKSSNVRIVDPAPEAWQVRPVHSRNIMLGLLLGMFLGIMTALVIEHLSDRLTTPQEAVSSLQLPVLGVVPHVASVDGGELDLWALTDSRSTYSESFRRLLVQVKALPKYPESGAAVILCSSGVPREGKSLSVLNLGIASAQAGRRTLLIDGDMRNPRLHHAFEVALVPGLCECIESSTLHEDVVQPTRVDNLFLLPAGSTDMNPAEALARADYFGKLIEGLREQYDLIVVDSPPVAAFSDATQMADSADLVLLIVSRQSSSRAAAVQAITDLSRVGAAPDGILFNQDRRAGLSDYYYYGYRSSSSD